MGDFNDQKGVHKYENIQFFFRRHWTHFAEKLFVGFIIFIFIFIIFFLFGQLVIYLDFLFLYPFFVFCSMVIGILYLNVFFLQLFNFFFDLVIVTNVRILIIRKTLFLQNDNDAIDLTKIQDISVVSHGFLRNYLHFGSLVIMLSTATPPIIIPCVPHPHYYLEQMNRVKRYYILDRQAIRQPSAPAYPKTLNYLRDVGKL